MTYNVFGGTLNLAQSINLSMLETSRTLIVMLLMCFVIAG